MPPEKIWIQAKNIDAAAGEIIGVLEDTSKGNVIYFKGWEGFGASAVLNLVAQRLKSSTRLNKFDKVIHVDCSVWKSMRALQKVVAEELDLPQSVMAIFDLCDEEDDFNGMDQGSRGVIADIRREIFRKLVNSIFVVVFHNGSRRYIDLYDCGVPVTTFLSNKMLWTWHGRFRSNLILEEGEKEKMKSQTDVRLFPSHTGCEIEEGRDVLHEEALEVAKCTGIVHPDDMSHKIVMECLIYRTLIVTDMKTHAPNYWICDGIIQGQDNASAWEIGNSLHRNMCLDFDLTYNEETTPVLQVSDDLLVNRWNFTTHKQLLEDKAGALPPQVTSFFLFADESPTDRASILPVSMFQHSQSSKLRVLHLSHCTFSFASPPFVHCVQLRLLHLDHCRNITEDDEHPSHNEDISCFQKLWVLDLRYTHWSWLLSEKMKRLMVELRELNVEGVKHGSISDLWDGRHSLVILRVTAADPVPTENKDKYSQAQFPNMSSTNSLTTSSFINDVLPSLLESFSFSNKSTTTAKISSISFRGCSQLKNILLRGNLGSLEELDLSGTAVKTLDLREVEAPNLKRLMLLGCEKLCAILWPSEDKRTRVLEKLQINTIQSASPSHNNSEEKTNDASTAAGSSSILTFGASPQDIGRTASFEFQWYISVVDPRLMWSLLTFQQQLLGEEFVYMEIGSFSATGAAVGGCEVAQGIASQQQITQYLYARDILQERLQVVSAIEGVISWMWACPPIPTPSPRDCWYFHMQDEESMERGSLQRQHNTKRISTSVASAPLLICNYAKMLYVHDSSSITCVPCPQGSRWPWLKWCRVERCPKLCSVFATPQLSDDLDVFWSLSTFWASQLLKARYIWNWSAVGQPGGDSFEDLAFLHLDYCPRLIHVLPLSEHMDTLPSLETLEIVCCGDLKEVFSLDPNRQEKQETIEFPKLRRIHLYQLSNLQSICGSRMSAPNLETVRIRGCWGLRRLPAVSGSTTNRPKVDCEKDWWDNLEWDGVEAKHDPSLYEPSHSRYYKKAHVPRVTVLR
ncbi:hypothetical protein CFC21_027383 [Triticum aestivum]|uniref:Disease resistance protein At4g27190-like leucine-rich repeats domain-containing protein n=2 Tax=Triticum aestivum TaxID=4565 RepID=A0A3B6D8F5_WHEAT|nr:uncharacterized protein LOC123051153 isoform X1 [Triticum aestivum]XP_044329895.1 uncharacterized protein LOC123051153 isoform X2 [Triticum aestivum]XP_044329896.1 uncharacterized protein LOC123051153 isoform X1 [Triticum aestivum]KAF7013291.1 hypothetical protein CFC21_027383 [Triticum aestivum]